jgi:hypothetical protein
MDDTWSKSVETLCPSARWRAASSVRILARLLGTPTWILRLPGALNVSYRTDRAVSVVLFFGQVCHQFCGRPSNGFVGLCDIFLRFPNNFKDLVESSEQP